MKSLNVVTHSGVFHADEVFAIAVLKSAFGKENVKIDITRTRDSELISDSDIAVDVGEKYSHSKKRYDHHQKDKIKPRDNGIPYASFGLIWKHFGKKLSSNKKVLSYVEQKLVMPIDAMDNGVSISNSIFEGIRDYSVFQVFAAINSSFGKGKEGEAFEKCVELAELIIHGEISKAEQKIDNDKKVSLEIENQGQPELLILEQYLSWNSVVSKIKNIKFVIFPEGFSTNWCIQAARDDLNVFDNDRANFPHEWRGLSNDILVSVAGVEGAVFCHKGGFYAVNKSKAGAIEMAKKTLAATV